MDFEIVGVKTADYPAALEPGFVSFGQTRMTEEEIDDAMVEAAEMRAHGARADGKWVGLTGTFALDLTVPGGNAVAASGVTWVGVTPTHRRRGIATALMAAALDDAVAHGDSVAILLAMEASIYGRFGFGVATEFASVSIDASAAGFAVELRDPGRLELVDHVEGTRLAALAWERQRTWRPGTINRLEWMWEQHRRDRESDRDGASARFWVIHFDTGGDPDGFACYRIKEDEDHGLPRFVAKVSDLVGVSADVEAILLRYLCDLDLVHQVDVEVRPVVDPIRWRLADRRQLRVTSMADYLWVRVLDVAAAFSARRYETADELVVQVHDEFRPAAGGRFVIAGGPDRARCERTDAPAEIELDASALASLLLGTVPAVALADAGRLEAGAGVVERADPFFASSQTPFCCTPF